MSSPRLLVTAALAHAAFACASTDDPQAIDAAAPFAPAPAVELIDHGAWRQLPLESDPFWDLERDYKPCGDADWLIEGAVEPYLELQTGACNYATLVQESLAEVQGGDVIALALSHTSLNGMDAMGRAAILLGDTELWSRTVPVRTEPESHNVSWIAPAAFPAGTTVTFHVDNHGDNAWRLLRLTRVAR